MAYARLEPFGSVAEDHRTAQLLALTYYLAVGGGLTSAADQQLLVKMIVGRSF